MSTKKTKKIEKPVGVTLYFDEDTLVAKLIKRVPGANYKRAQTLIEEAFCKRFGKERVIHKRGSTSTSVEDADTIDADVIAATFSLHEDVISLSYTRSEKALINNPNAAALEILQHGVEDAKANILRLEKAIKAAEENLEDLRAKKTFNAESLAGIKGTIKALGG